MPVNKKLVTLFIWILFAVLIGVGISYIIIKSSTRAYGAIYDKTQVNSNILIGNAVSSQEENNSEVSKEISSDTPKINDTISIGFVGDIVPGINASENILSDVTLNTEKPDIMMGNFEGVVTNNIYFKCKPDSLNCFSFNGDDVFLGLLSKSSFDVLNVANNHFNDYGEIGQEETIKEIRKAGIITSGIKNEITYITKNNFTIGIVGFSTYSWTTNMNNEETLKKIISVADQNSNIVIVVFHGGGEGIKYTHTPSETELYLGEDRGNLRAFGQSSIDAGADIVIGSGPHVLRGIEWYKGKLIAYSLGNFASVNSLLTSGLLKTTAMIEASFKKDGSFVSGAIVPFEIDTNGIPHPDLNNTSITIINDLSKNDFGKQGIELDSSGEIKMQ